MPNSIENVPFSFPALYDLASILAARSQYTEALALVEEALLRSSGVMKPEHWRVARIQTLRATCEPKSGLGGDAGVDLGTTRAQSTIGPGTTHPELQTDVVPK